MQQYLDRLLVRWLCPLEPVYRLEAGRITSGEMARLAKRGRRGCLIMLAALLALGLGLVCLVAGLGGFVGIFLFLIFFVVFIGPFMVPIFYLILRVRVVTSTSDTIAREVEAQTWDVLRTLPYSTEMLVRSKYAGALLRNRRVFYQILLLRVGAAVWLMTLSLPLIAFGGDESLGWWLVSLAGFLYYLVETGLNFAADGALGMVASSYGRTRGRALALSVALGVVFVGGQTLLDVVIAAGFINIGSVACITGLGIGLALRYAAYRGLMWVAVARATGG